MPAKPLTPTQLAEARALKSLFKAWQDRQRSQGLPWSQAFASEQLGFGQSAINQYLNGQIPLNIVAALKFAELLGLRILDFGPSIAQEMQQISHRVDDRMLVAEHIRPYTVVTVEAAVQLLANHLARLGDKERKRLALLLADFAEEPDGPAQQWIVERLSKTKSNALPAISKADLGSSTNETRFNVVTNTGSPPAIDPSILLLGSLVSQRGTSENEGDKNGGVPAEGNGTNP